MCAGMPACLLYASACLIAQLVWNMGAFDLDRVRLHKYCTLSTVMRAACDTPIDPSSLMNDFESWNATLPYNGERSLPLAAWLNITGLRTLPDTDHPNDDPTDPDAVDRSARSDDLLIHFMSIIGICALINFAPRSVHRQATRDIFCGNWEETA